MKDDIPITGASAPQTVTVNAYGNVFLSICLMLVAALLFFSGYMLALYTEVQIDSRFQRVYNHVNNLPEPDLTHVHTRISQNARDIIAAHEEAKQLGQSIEGLKLQILKKKSVEELREKSR